VTTCKLSLFEASRLLTHRAHVGLLSSPSRGSPKKDLQFVYCNRKPVSSSMVHKLVNQIYAPFMREAVKHASGRMNSGRREGLKIREQTTTLYPTFVVNICCSPNQYDLLAEDGKSTVDFTGIEHDFRACS
jgi:hypothetical protein